MDDWKLLRDYVERNSGGAFRDLVDRYLALVRSVALRQVNDTQLAEEIVQAVFILLARKAGGFRRHIVLPAWLFRTTRFVAARALRAERRRERREQEAIQMQQLSAHDDAWRNIAPVLDEALEQLGETDRNAVILRFFQEQNSRSIGQALGLSEPAAKKRVTRALDKLRAYFAGRGFNISATVLAGVLVEHAVKASPAGSSADVASLALSHTVSGAASLPELAGATLRAWRRMRIQMAVKFGAVATAIALLLTGVILSIGYSSYSAKAPGKARASMAADQSVPSISADTAASHGPANVRSLAFRVVDAETERGLAGAGVHARYWHDWQVDPRDDLVTDRTGSCNVPLPEAGLGRLDIGVQVEGYVQKFVTWRPVTSDAVPEEYTLKLERGVSMGGWVRDEFDVPVAGAEVLVHFAGAGDSDSREPE